MSDVYQCDNCKPSCFLVAQDDTAPIGCPFCKADGKKGVIRLSNSDLAEWRQIA